MRLCAALAGMFALILGLVQPTPGLLAAATASTLTFSPDADAYVVEADPANNYGKLGTLLVDADDGAGNAYVTYLRFNVQGVAGTVDAATLRLYVTDSTGNGPALYGTTSDWSETGITWNTRPAATSGVVDDTGSVSAGSWVEYNVAPLLAGNGAYTFMLVSSSRDGVDFNAREAGSDRPTLVVAIAGSPVATPIPTATATAVPSPSRTAVPTATPAPVDSTPPMVRITSPSSGATYTSPQTVVFTLQATDDTDVTLVEFYDNGVLQGSEDTSPFGYSWAISSAQNGVHTWTAKAYDAAGNHATSAAVQLTVKIAPSQDEPASPITASVETPPVPNSGDAADDPAIWIHPTDPALSTVIGANKLGGLAVYDLSGKQLHYYSGIKPNNVDLRYNFPLGGQRVTLVTFSNRTDDSIGVYRVNPSTRGLEPVAARTISAGIGLYGLCMYHSPSSGKYYVFDNDNNGIVQQWELYDTGAGKVDARKVRQFDVGATTEGCVADDELSHFYVSEEDVAIWKYGAEPGAGTSRTQVDKAGSGGRLTQDIEGLAIYYAGNGRGYLLASSQGSNSFVVYERQGSNAYVTTFGVSAGTVDAVTYTDGIDVTNFGLGSAFPEGLFVAQDDRNDGGNQNFKLVPWRGIARTGSPDLTVDTSWDPRRIGQ